MILIGKTQAFGKNVLGPFCPPHEEFVVVILILGQGFLGALQFPTVNIIPPILYIHSTTTYPII